MKALMEFTVVLILAYLVLTNGSAFSGILRSAGGTYVSVIKAFQGR